MEGRNNETQKEEDETEEMKYLMQDVHTKLERVEGERREGTRE